MYALQTKQTRFYGPHCVFVFKKSVLIMHVVSQIASYVTKWNAFDSLLNVYATAE